MEIKKRICKLCKKRVAKEFHFCEDCLSKENRDNNFQERIRILVDLNKGDFRP